MNPAVIALPVIEGRHDPVGDDAMAHPPPIELMLGAFDRFNPAQFDQPPSRLDGGPSSDAKNLTQPGDLHAPIDAIVALRPMEEKAPDQDADHEDGFYPSESGGHGAQCASWHRDRAVLVLDAAIHPPESAHVIEADLVDRCGNRKRMTIQRHQAELSQAVEIGPEFSFSPTDEFLDLLKAIVGLAPFPVIGRHVSPTFAQFKGGQKEPELLPGYVLLPKQPCGHNELMGCDFDEPAFDPL